MNQRLHTPTIVTNGKIFAWGILANLGVKRARKHQIKLNDLQ
jgi:hypothetical protein